MSEPSVEVLVCRVCLAGAEKSEATERPGAVLARRMAQAAPEGIRVTEVECLSNCSQGCTIALRGGARWTYIYGRITADGDLEPIIEGLQKYAATSDGVVPWRERPEHFRKNCIARIPPIKGLST